MDSPLPFESPPDDAPADAAAWPSIAAVERDTGLGKDTLRVWERRYGFPVPQRDAHGERLYPPSQVDKLRLLKRLVDHGHRPGRIVALPMDDLRRLAEPYAGDRAAAAGQDGQTAADIDELLDLLLSHRLESLRHHLGRLQLLLGLERFVADVVLPLNTRIGDAWMRGRLEVYQEHACSELLQTQLRQAAAAVPPADWDAADGPRLMLTTLPGEPHGHALLVAEALLRLHGLPCRSLGTQTPVWDIALAAQAWQVDVVVLAVGGSVGPNQVLGALNELRAKLGAGVALWVGGSAPVLFRRPVPGVVAHADLPQLVAAARRWRRPDGAG